MARERSGGRHRSGIGDRQAVVHRFVEEGAKVVAFDLSEARLNVLKEELGEVAVVQGDVRRPDDNRRAVTTAVSAFGKLSVFVGNAGIHDGRRKLESLSDEELDNAGIGILPREFHVAPCTAYLT